MSKLQLDNIGGILKGFVNYKMKNVKITANFIFKKHLRTDMTINIIDIILV